MIKVFTVLKRVEGGGLYSGIMRDYFKLNDLHGFDGCLIFQNNSNDVDPWTVAQELLMRSDGLTAFVAINPVYMHPYSIAQRILSFTRLYERKLYLNFITGTSLSDLDAMERLLTHEQRYDRLIEYMDIVRHLLTDPSPLSYKGIYYVTKNLRLSGRVDQCFVPEFFIAGSSADAGRARQHTGAGRIEMAKPLVQKIYENDNMAFNFGILASESAQLARDRLLEEYRPRYPEAKELLEYSLLNSDSVWKQQLLNASEDVIYRLEPLKHFNADCPYLVGSYEQVADYWVDYVRQGIRTFIVDADGKDLASIQIVMEMVKKKLRTQGEETTGNFKIQNNE